MGCGDRGVLELGEWRPEGVRAGRDRDMEGTGIGTQGPQTKGGRGHGEAGTRGDKETW